MGLKKKLGKTLLSLLLVLSMVFVHPAFLTVANAEETYGGIEIEKDVCWGFENSTAGMSVHLDVPSGNVTSKAALLMSSNDSTGIRGYSMNYLPCSGSVVLAVQCLKQGTYTVSVETLFSSDGKTYSDTCTVVVLPGNASGVQLTAYEHTMQLGEKFRLYGVFARNKNILSNIQFTSSDPKVATVAADGTITAVAPGQADIIASSNGYTAKCAVTVQGIQFEHDTHWEMVIPAPSSLGNRIYYTAEVPAGSAYSIESSNPNVVSENAAANRLLAEHSCSGEGFFYIRGIAPGTATLTIRTSDGKYMDTCTVIVIPRDTTGVCLSAYDRMMQTGDKFKLDASYVQYGAAFYDKVAIQFTSSNPNAAVVAADGTITAVAPGQADIIATMGGYTAKCVVTVPAPVVEASSVALNTTSLSMVAGDKMSLSATVSPANTTDKSVTWTSDNTSVATVDANGLVTAKAAGTTTITATTSNGKTASCAVTVYHYTRTAYMNDGGTVWLGEPNKVVNEDRLRVKNNGTGSAGYYTREAYAKFNIAGLKNYAENNGLEIEKVHLKFRTAATARLSDSRTVYVHQSDNNWKGSTLTYSNSPIPGQQIGSAVINGNMAYGSNYTEKVVDVTDYILSKMESGDAASVAFTASQCGGESIMIPKANVRLVAVYKIAE